MCRFKDITGEKFGRLEAIEVAYRTAYGKIMWRCKCECGNEKIVQGGHLRSGSIKSCGCLLRETSKSNNLIHGESKTKLYRRWKGMRERCRDINHKSYKDYGGRGITVCDEWNDEFIAFKNWAIENGFREDLELDRIDVDGNYEPSNCRWITHREQMYNTRKHKERR